MVKKSVLLAVLMSAAPAFAGQYFSVDMQRETLNNYDDSSTQSIISGTYSIDANDYVRLNMSLGTSLSDGELRTQVDTFRQPSSLSTISATEYKTTAEVKSRASISASLNLPLSSFVDAVAHIGYSTTNVSLSGYDVFVDHQPTQRPESEWSSLGECELTGIESRCNEAIQSVSDDLSLKGVFYAVGLDWRVSDSTSLFAGYRREGDADIDMRGVTLSIRFAL